MWPWTKRWRDWAMNDLWSMHRSGLQPQALHYSYEKAGLTLHDQAIPWNAEAVLVEASLKLPAGPDQRKSDFQLRLGRHEPFAAESLRREDGSNRHRVFFRFAVPNQTVAAELLFRSHGIGQLTLPVLARDDFLNRLQLQMPTLYVRFGDQSVACQTFVATQCKGLLASAVLNSPTSLVPLLDLGLQMEFRSERGGAIPSVAARLSSSQLAGRQALITLVPRQFPRRIGTWLATWIVGDRPLAVQHIRAISQNHFRRSLRISDTRFVVQGKEQPVALSRHMPPMDGVDRIGPCFLISSREPGMAGLSRLEVRAQVPGSIQPPLLVDEEVLITDGPTMFAPGTVHTSDLCHVTAFELRVAAIRKTTPNSKTPVGGRNGVRKSTRSASPGSTGAIVGILPLRPAPAAGFTAEGGYRAAHEFNWSPAAEDELHDRLTRLLNARTHNG
jgi:hypothetical protein